MAAVIGRRRRIPFEIDNGRHVGGLTHFDLLNHPDVYEQIRTWMAGPHPGETERYVAEKVSTPGPQVLEPLIG